RIQNAHLGNALHRQLVAAGGEAHGLRCRGVIDTEGAPLVRAHIGVNPGDFVSKIVLNHGKTEPGSPLVSRYLQSAGKLPFDDITRHGAPRANRAASSWVAR